MTKIERDLYACREKLSPRHPIAKRIEVSKVLEQQRAPQIPQNA
jgi:hypothetical protein